MDKAASHKLVKDTLENPFDKSRYAFFVKNLIKKYNEAKAFAPISGAYIPEIYRPYIRSYERLGTYSNGNTIDILIVNLQKQTSLERARTAQRNFIAHHLKQRNQKDAALVAVVSPDPEDWRFSLVKMDYEFAKTKTGRLSVREEFTPAKRWSFLVGTNESSHTAQSRLAPLLLPDVHPNLANLEEAFNIESVTREFFEKYRELFLRAKDELDKSAKKDPIIWKDFEEKGVDTANFAKKLMGQIVFLYFLQRKGWFGVGRDAEWGTGPKNFLRQLFEQKHAEYKNFFNDILEPLFYNTLAVERPQDYSDRFNCKIPFLNGGLFDPIGDYDWVKTDILIPNDLFSNTRKTKQGDQGDGILDVFDRYNFTVKEDEPLEKDVAVDPEMLGKVFENLLEIKDRKSKGTYYTPRPIVHYMCVLSLANYLETEMNGKVSKEDLETLVQCGDLVGENEARVGAKGQETETYYYKLPESIRNNAKIIDDSLANVKICDPAIGSGAFPVGMMTEIVRARNVLSSYLKSPQRSLYNFKRECIQNSLYGVDIDPGAIEIAKLRLWLSLVVDENDINVIHPLPNLDYKIIAGNSLSQIEKDLFNQFLLEDLEKLKVALFSESRHKRKLEHKKQIDKLISQISFACKDFDYEVYFSEVFHDKKGFDIVIANPPYISNKKMHKENKQLDIATYKKNYFSMKSGNCDIYILFIEKSLSLLKAGGTINFIVPNKLLVAKYSKALLEHLLNCRYLTRIDDFSKANVFEHASVYPIVIEIVKKANTTLLRNEFGLNIGELVKLNSQTIALQEATMERLQPTKKEQPLLDKIFQQTIPLGKELAVSPGINGFQFTNYGKCIYDGLPPKLAKKENKRVVISGSIDKYLIKKDGIRYNKRKLSNPKIIYDPDVISPGKWQLFSSPKIVIAGMATEIEAYHDTDGSLAPGVNVYSIFESNKLKFGYILAYLNSQLSSWLFRTLFYDKHLAGDYISINATLIKKLPIKVIDIKDQQKFTDVAQEIVQLVNTSDYNNTSSAQREVDSLLQKIDGMFYSLYNLSKEEISIIKATKS